VNKILLIILFAVLGTTAQAQKTYTTKIRKMGKGIDGVTIDSTTAKEKQKIDTSVDYDLTDLFNLNLSESERAQAKAIIAVFTDQINNDTSNISAYINRGSYWATLGLHVQAIKDYNRALLIDENQPIIYYNRALSKARFFYTYDACTDLKKSRDLGLQQAGVILSQKCGRHKAKLDAIPDSASAAK
jgi:tetratricopeptide (TPR) repeat protein